MSTPQYFGKYKAIVTKINDPDEERARIKVKCPAVLGEYESAWCEPCFPCAYDFGGDFHLPKLGDTIWVEFEEGNPNKPIWAGNWHSQRKTSVIKARDSTNTSSAPPLEYSEAHNKVRIIQDFDVWIVIHEDYMRIYRKDTEIFTNDDEVYVERTGGRMKFFSNNAETYLRRDDSELIMVDNDTQLLKAGSSIKLEPQKITVTTKNVMIDAQNMNITLSGNLTETADSFERIALTGDIKETAQLGNITNKAPLGSVSDKDMSATHH